MSDTSSNNSSYPFYGEGVDPEADLVLVCGEKEKDVAAAAFALDKLLTEEPKWPRHVLTAMVRFILPRTWLSSGELLQVITDQVKGIHASTTVALFQHVVRKFDTATRYESDMRNLKAGNVVKYALHEQRER